MVVAYLRRLSSIVLACLARRVLYVAHRLVCGAFGLVDALVSSEPDIEEALNRGGWKAAAVILYRDHLLESRPRSHRAARQGSILHLQAYRPVPRRCAY